MFWQVTDELEFAQKGENYRSGGFIQVAQKHCLEGEAWQLGWLNSWGCWIQADISGASALVIDEQARN